MKAIMDMLENKIVQYFIDVCQEQEYSFVTNKEKTQIHLYPLDEIEGHVNQSWNLCDLEWGSFKTFELLLIKDTSNARFSKLKKDFFEIIWNKCKNQQEQDRFIELFLNHISNARYLPFAQLEYTKDSNYMNSVLKAFFKLNAKEVSNDDILNPLIDMVIKNKMVVTVENLINACKCSKRTLNSLKNKKKLKDYVEQYF
jgi:hypothetical protein